MKTVYLVWRSHGDYEDHRDELIAAYLDKRKAEAHKRGLYAEIRRLTKFRQIDESKAENGYLPSDWWSKNLNRYDPEFTQIWSTLPEYKIGEMPISTKVQYLASLPNVERGSK